MGKHVNIVNALHTRTERDYLARMNDDKVACMQIAREYERDYWDGDRRSGYGGYHYDGRWEPVARNLVERYNLKDGARILDVGCGKGFLLFELWKLIPSANVVGFDRSRYAIAHAKEEIRDCLYCGRAEDPYRHDVEEFDLVISLTTLHNLMIGELVASLKEIERVGKQKYIVVESYRSEQELFNLQCWALTAESYFRPEEWKWVFDVARYTGDYEFIYF